MKSISKLIEELCDHPDFIGGEIWTKDNIIDEIINGYQNEYDELPWDSFVDITRDDITDVEWDDFGDEIESHYEMSNINNGLPFSVHNKPNLDKKLKRKIKLNYLTNKTNDDEINR